MEKIDLTGLYITDDIIIEDIDQQAEFERYEYTENIDDFLQWVQDYSNKATDDEKATAKSFAEVFPESLGDIREWINEGHHADVYDEWRDNLSHEEQYSVPMMNALRYFPDFVSFSEEDRYKCSGSTCLLYDTEREAWAVGMTGGGMDLAPHLLATFINLKHCIPIELAHSIRRDYSAYVNKKTHAHNCEILAQAFEDHAERDAMRAKDLRTV